MRLKIKKLALAFQTGWEYMPDSGEAGSVLMDAFCDMLLENNRRMDHIWEKHMAEFFSAMPGEHMEAPVYTIEAGICAQEGGDGKWLPEETGVYLTSERGDALKFAAVGQLQLTAAELLYVFWQDGLWIWQIYERGEKEWRRKEITAPVFCWKYEKLCNGRGEVRYAASLSAVSGKWSIFDGGNRYFLQAQSTDEGLLLWGETPAFRDNKGSCVYEIQLEFSEGERLPEDFADKLCRPLFLKEEQRSSRVLFCLTEDGVTDGERVLPFGRTPEPAFCCYFACDDVLAAKDREITLEFTESFLMEQKLPGDVPEQYRKLYKKYPWLKEQDTVGEWKAEETVWEYFNGSFWLPLPGSGEWRTGCVPVEREIRRFGWTAPKDMSPCMVEGQEYYYIRLRLEKAEGMYAQYYRKWIPVLENVSFSAAGGRIEPIECIFPETEEAGRKKLLFGFDREITEANRWYTGDGVMSFQKKEIAGWNTRYGKEAFWAEAERTKMPETVYMIPNYVQAKRVESGEEDRLLPLKAEAGQLLSVETKSAGVLDARLLKNICFTDIKAFPDAGGKEADSYPAAFGRLVTQRDIQGWFRKRYPAFFVKDCIFQKEDNELKVVLGRKPHMPKEETPGILQEMEGRLKESLAVQSQLWLASCHVSCILNEQKRESGEKHGRQDKAGRQQL